jgi:glucose-1-phosphate cytidylyltransferase
MTFDVATRKMEVHHNEAEPWRVTLIDTGLATMTGGRLKRIQEYLDRDVFLMTYGDGLGNVDLSKLIDFHASHGKLATVTATPPPSRWGVIDLVGDRVDAFREKTSVATDWINAGFFVLSPRVLDYIDGDTTAWEKEPMESLAREGQLCAFRHTGFWRPMDTLRDKVVLEELWQSGQAPWQQWGTARDKK